MPTLAEFVDLLRERVHILESLEHPHYRQESHFQIPTINTQASHIKLSINTKKYYLCKEDHSIYTCNEFLKLGISERWENIKILKLCANFLRIEHTKDNCY